MSKVSAGTSGFTLIEVAVAMLVAMIVIASIATLGEGNLRQRATSEASSAAMSLAVKQMESLKAITTPNLHGDLTAGTHSVSSLDETGNVAVGGRYTVTWVVVDDVPAAGSKRITVTVTHSTASNVRAEITTYHKI